MGDTSQSILSNFTELYLVLESAKESDPDRAIAELRNEILCYKAALLEVVD